MHFLKLLHLFYYGWREFEQEVHKYHENLYTEQYVILH
jgi:hypothetical protein